MASREKARANKLRLIEAKGGKCFDCGGIFHQCCYHFDHRDPYQKTFNLSDHLHWPLERLQEEADKCDLVCANCHALRTFVHKREAISKKQGEAQRGRKLSAEVRAHMSAAQKGHPTSPEARLKQSIAAKNRKPRVGWHHTEEAKEKMRQARYVN